jgi:hypothetical protein
MCALIWVSRDDCNLNPLVLGFDDVLRRTVALNQPMFRRMAFIAVEFHGMGINLNLELALIGKDHGHTVPPGIANPVNQGLPLGFSFFPGPIANAPEPNMGHTLSKRQGNHPGRMAGEDILPGRLIFLENPLLGVTDGHGDIRVDLIHVDWGLPLCDLGPVPLSRWILSDALGMNVKHTVGYPLTQGPRGRMGPEFPGRVGPGSIVNGMMTPQQPNLPLLPGPKSDGGLRKPPI